MKKRPLSRKLIDPNLYQVLLCCSPANVMVGFAAHTWFLVNRKGTISRWEVLHFKKDRELSMGYLHKDYFEAFTGIEVWQHYTKYHWKGSVLSVVSGDEDSIAADMVDLIENSYTEYPFTETYSLIGLNSNTYTQWVIDQFPQAQLVLPWNAFGRNFDWKKYQKTKNV